MIIKKIIDPSASRMSCFLYVLALPAWLQRSHRGVPKRSSTEALEELPLRPQRCARGDPAEVPGETPEAPPRLLPKGPVWKPLLVQKCVVSNGFTIKTETCDRKNGKRARGMGTKHRLTILESKLALVDHLHPRSPCSHCLQTKKSLIHPLRGAWLRSAPHSSHKEQHVFPVCRPCLPRLYLAWPKRCSRGALTQAPARPRRAPREVTPEVPREAPEEHSQRSNK